MYHCGIKTLRHLCCEHQQLAMFADVFKTIHDFRRPVLDAGFPTRRLLLTATPPDLTENKIVGSYYSVPEYVQTHYDLLLEDFMCPLRKAIQKFKRKTSCPDTLNGARVYKKVALKSVQGSKWNMTCFLDLDAGSTTHAEQPSFGRLLVFTREDFNTLFVGTVISGSRPGETDEVEVRLKLPKDCKIKKEQLGNDNFIMIEAEAFYYVYFHVLKALQELSECNFPMKRYIIDGTKDTEPRPPAYMTESTLFNIFGHEGIPVLNHKKWPPLSATDLDESQYNALKSALTEEVAAIQGPPGTGKTYLGVRIIKVLLDNVSVWNTTGSTPLLVVTQSNQALDHFLEGILKYTTDVVRIGDRCQSKQLKPYTLKELVCRRLITTVKKKGLNSLKMCLTGIDDTRLLLRKLSQGILDLKVLESFGVISEKTLLCFNSEESYLKWLGFEIKVDKKYADSSLIVSIKQLEELIEHLKSVDDLSMASHVKTELDKIQTLIQNYKEGCRQYIPENVDILSLSPNDAQKIYLLWVDALSVRLQGKLSEKETDLIMCWESLPPKKSFAVAREILRSSKVVGLTSTGAASRRGMLEYLQSPIVIIDEAAKVLESHVVVSMTESCEHLILLGDHKQLKPSVTTHHLGSQFHLNVSLFERLLNNEVVAGTCLTKQYRMRPEISCLLKPHIYKVLHDAAETKTRPSIRGLEKNMFFLNHAMVEQANVDNTGFWNPHEVEMLINLSIHLVSVGYAPSDITIISMYSEQMKKLIEARDAVPSLAILEIASVDSFQGKENEIILLSLVRSNNYGGIGFLKEENRICVALSRARSGLFIMGNMKCLTKSSQMWKSVHQRLLQRGAFVDELRLVCERHKTVRKVSKMCDWAKT